MAHNFLRSWSGLIGAGDSYQFIRFDNKFISAALIDVSKLLSLNDTTNAANLIFEFVPYADQTGGNIVGSVDIILDIKVDGINNIVYISSISASRRPHFW